MVAHPTNGIACELFLIQPSVAGSITLLMGNPRPMLITIKQLYRNDSGSDSLDLVRNIELYNPDRLGDPIRTIGDMG